MGYVCAVATTNRLITLTHSISTSRLAFSRPSPPPLSPPNPAPSFILSSSPPMNQKAWHHVGTNSTPFHLLLIEVLLDVCQLLHSDCSHSGRGFLLASHKEGKKWRTTCPYVISIIQTIWYGHTQAFSSLFFLRGGGLILSIEWCFA